ncbi:hypothetical protein HDV00_003683 [Rhizophlyctis rosea]|nr:hypothetical protein HDV00_003683 [Rhizophlyctis rosea]
MRDLLLHDLKDLQNLARMNGRSADFLQIMDNDPINLFFRDSYYQSNNILVRIQGRLPSRKALLVSAHFDSTPFSPGITDDGISVAVMVELVRSLIFHPILDHDVILNFNNGEEMWLWGGFAFTQHPWFADVTGFLNLEGTGAASDTRAMLFRTNSWKIMESFTKRAPRPHASIILNDVMRYIGSDTDYRPYVTVGELPGADFAFYSYRYLYHTPRDDLGHASALSVQHLGDNVLATLVDLCTGDRLLELEHPAKIANYSETLPGPGFLYYDILGVTSVLTQYWLYVFGMSLILTLVIAGSIWKATREVKRRQMRRMLVMFVRPMLDNYFGIWASVLGSAFVVWVLSKFKGWVNRSSTYGMPAWNACWVVAVTIGTTVAVQAIWPHFAMGVRLRRGAGGRYSLLPSTAPVENDHARPADIDDSEDEDESPLNPGPRPPTISTTPRIMTQPSSKKWLPYSLVGYWTTLLVVALVFAAKGVNAAYLFYVYALFGCLSAGLSQLITRLVRRWWRADVRSSLEADDAREGGATGPGDDVDPGFKRRMVEGWTRDRWCFDLFVSSFIPLLLTLDIAKMLYIAIPSLVAEGLRDYHADLVFWMATMLATVNLLPVWQQVNRKLIMLLFFLGAVVPFIVSCALFPFSYDRPQKFVFAESWDVSNATSLQMGTEVTALVLPSMKVGKWIGVVKGDVLGSREDWNCEWDKRYDRCVAGGFEALDVRDGNGKSWVDPTTLIEVSATLNRTGGTRRWKGSVVGPPESRICTIRADPAPLGLWVDPENADEWVTINGTHPTPGLPSPTSQMSWVMSHEAAGMSAFSVDTNSSPPTFVFLRGFGREDKRFEAEFLVLYNEGAGADGDNPVIKVECFLGGNVSPTFDRVVHGGIPKWMTLTHGRYGVSSIKKNTKLE